MAVVGALQLQWRLAGAGENWGGAGEATHKADKTEGSDDSYRVFGWPWLLYCGPMISQYLAER